MIKPKYTRGKAVYNHNEKSRLDEAGFIDGSVYIFTTCLDYKTGDVLGKRVFLLPCASVNISEEYFEMCFEIVEEEQEVKYGSPCGDCEHYDLSHSEIVDRCSKGILKGKEYNPNE